MGEATAFNFDGIDALQNVELGAGINGQSDVGCRFETQSGVSVAMEQGDLIESPRIRVFNEKYVDQIRM